MRGRPVLLCQKAGVVLVNTREYSWGGNTRRDRIVEAPPVLALAVLEGPTSPPVLAKSEQLALVLEGPGEQLTQGFPYPLAVCVEVDDDGPVVFGAQMQRGAIHSCHLHTGRAFGTESCKTVWYHFRQESQGDL